MFRTHRLNEGAALHEVTTEITAAWGIGARLIPVTNDRIETRVTVVDEGEIGFQEYFVRRHHDVAVTNVRFVGAETAQPAPGVIEAITDADVVIVAPSNPIVSIGPLLAVPGITEALQKRRDSVVAVSPIVGGKALKGPAERLMRELGVEPSPIGVAGAYAHIASTLVIDAVDAEQASAVEDIGTTCVVTDTVMRTPDVAADLCRTIIATITETPLTR
jgi:LPPG:FO 2-phospho-L-lactate transferase